MSNYVIQSESEESNLEIHQSFLILTTHKA